MYLLNKDILLRFEFFGGVLINKNNFSRYELNKSQIIFLKALDEVGNLENAEKIHDAIIEKKEYDINKLIQMGIIVVDNAEEQNNYNNELIIESLKEKLKELSEYSFLSAPLEVTIYPTLNCNLDCKFCFLKNKISTEVNIKKWLEIIAEAKSIGILSVSILGGEPSIYKEIDELLLGIESIGIKATITTNGTKLKESTKKILLNSKYITPVISLQCLNYKNKELMGTEYTKQLEVVEYFIKNSKPVRINSVYTNQSEEDFFEMIDFVVNRGIDRYSIATYVASNETNSVFKTKTLADSRILDEKIQAYINERYKNKKVNYLVEGCLLYSAYPEIMNEIGDLSEFNKLYYGCRAARTKIEIYANGDVYPCICFENQIQPTSNILKDTLIDIWKYDLNMNLLRTQKVTNNTCLNCGFNDFCNGGCPAIKQKYYGEKYNQFKDPNCCICNDNLLELKKI